MKLELLQHEESGITNNFTKHYILILHNMSHRLLSFVSELSQLLLILATMDGGNGYGRSYGGYGGYRSYGGYGGYGYGKWEAEATADAEPGYGIYGLS